MCRVDLVVCAPFVAENQNARIVVSYLSGLHVRVPTTAEGRKKRNSAQNPPNQVLIVFLSRKLNSTGFTGVLSSYFLQKRPVLKEFGFVELRFFLPSAVAKSLIN